MYDQMTQTRLKTQAVIPKNGLINTQNKVVRVNGNLQLCLRPRSKLYTCVFIIYISFKLNQYVALNQCIYYT